MAATAANARKADSTGILSSQCVLSKTGRLLQSDPGRNEGHGLPTTIRASPSLFGAPCGYAAESIISALAFGSRAGLHWEIDELAKLAQLRLAKLPGRQCRTGIETR